jgi:prolyl-tRNA editing enzyme YbaK/EbsC (Cys-tRNA(Pro) deacylase)
MDTAVAETGMEYGGITPIGLPEGWPILVDARIVTIPYVIIGSGVRHSKIALPGELLARLPGARTVEGLGIER